MTEYIIFGYQNDGLPDLIVRDLSAKPPGSAPAQALPRDRQYTLQWDGELMDWVITDPFPAA